MSQQHLRLPQPSSARFDTFWPGPNAAVVAALQDFALNEDDGQHLLIGPADSGKSHLAQACCRARWDAGRQASYFELGRVPLNDDLLASLGAAGLLVIDGLERLRPDEELTLMRLVDRVRASASKILICSREWPEQLALQTADLRSRLQWGAMLELRRMDEQDLQGMLHHRAALLGVRLSEQVERYLLRRVARRPGALMAVLEQAYERAVEQRRQLTVPLLREMMSDTSS